MRDPRPFWRLGLYVSIAVISVITYLPAVDNFFISDDFTLLTYVKALDQDPLYVLEAPSEFFRVVSYVYFWTCSKFFGLNSVAYYAASIALHVLASLLVFSLVLRVTGRILAGWAAGLFFAAYERHQEAVMWISAANEAILTLNCLVFLLLWMRVRPWSHRLALVVFSLALFSKEAAVALLPLAVLVTLIEGFSWRETFEKCLPLALITAGYVYLWLSQAGSNAFVTGGHYALGLHFFPVYLRSTTRLLVPALLFLAPLLIVRKWDPIRQFLKDRTFLFFAAFVVLAIVPYSFLTYLTSIPSRNTYFPSVGLAGMVGMLFAAWYGELSSSRSRALAVGLLLAVLGGNIGYIWIKKDPQYLERAAPTRALIEALNSFDGSVSPDSSICVSDFPLHRWIGTESVKWFTRFTAANMQFSSACDPASNDVVLKWTDDAGLVRLHDSLAQDGGEVGSTP